MDLVYTLNDIDKAAALCWAAAGGRRVLALHGAMGSGKTTLTHALCSLKGVTEAVSSPTFALTNEYRAGDGQFIVHMDWYRLKDEEEAIRAGMEEYLYSGKICLVEWPDRAPGILPEETLHLHLAVIDRDARRLRTMG